MSLGERFVPHATPRVAWSIHLFTATGAVLGFFALVNVVEHHPKAALLWLMAAQVVDGVDGPLARMCEVKRLTPQVDGNVLDLVIDYMTCVIVPAMFIHQFGLLPDGLSMLGVSAIMFTALFCFARSDLMQEDNFFAGFPAAWNLVANTMFLVNTPRWINFLIVLFFAGLTFSSVKFAHPLRVVANRSITIPVTVAWLATMTVLTIVFPTSAAWAQTVLVVALGYFAFLSIRRTLADRQPVSLV
jgi:phosphatidylcholine synthase